MKDDAKEKQPFVFVPVERKSADGSTSKLEWVDPFTQPRPDPDANGLGRLMNWLFDQTSSPNQFLEIDPESEHELFVAQGALMGLDMSAVTREKTLGTLNPFNRVYAGANSSRIPAAPRGGSVSSWFKELRSDPFALRELDALTEFQAVVVAHALAGRDTSWMTPDDTLGVLNPGNRVEPEADPKAGGKRRAKR